MGLESKTPKIGFRPAVWATAERNPFDTELELTALGESLGLDAIFFGDRMLSSVHANGKSVYRSSHTEVIVTLSAMAARSQSIHISPLVLVAPFRHPVQLAKVTASLDLLSQGRLLLPLGAGWNPQEFQTLGIPKSEAAGRLEESIEIMRRLWGGDSVDFEGRYYTLKGASISPLPHRPGGPPIWLGSFGPMSEDVWAGQAFTKGTERSLGRVGRLADVWVPMLYDAAHRTQIEPAILNAAWERVQAESETAGRKDGVSFAFSHWFHCVESREDEEDLMRGLSAFFAGSLADAKQTYLIGSADEIIDRVGYLIGESMAPSWFILTMLSSSRRQLEILANVIAPRLRTLRAQA
jgi:alkanesulfonate monooxygenase SsuD/methylene tetrahydromethanopterin reductase-like flavin-dependent oxidoreductase (luciferase family)